jgi:hypothetical protein
MIYYTFRFVIFYIKDEKSIVVEAVGKIGYGTTGTSRILDLCMCECSIVHGFMCNIFWKKEVQYSNSHLFKLVNFFLK